MTTTTRRLMLAEYLALPETEPASEFVCGEVLQKPMPNGKHAQLQLWIGGLVMRFVLAAGLGRTGSEWRCVFGPPGRERAFVPDIAYIEPARLPADEAALDGPLYAAPSLAIEILSPGQPTGRFADKLQFYLLYGVRLVWVVDPIARTVMVFRPGAEAITLGEGDTLTGEDVLPGFAVSVAELFAPLAPPSPSAAGE